MTTTQNTDKMDEQEDMYYHWEDSPYADAVDDTDNGYKEMRNKRRDEWRDSKRVKQQERSKQRQLKRGWE